VERRLKRGLLEPFRSRGRVHVPTLSTWQLAADVDRRLRKLRASEGSLRQRSFSNDILIAASARQLGATIVTENTADFDIIARVLDVKRAPPWP
jgi:predicted nucleic acid-binding protein